MYKALMIDDEKPVHIVITALGKWQEYGIDIPVSAYNGKEGLELMREQHFDLVFVDMRMPVMDGAEFLDKASVEFPRTVFIVVSGFSYFSYAQSALKNGAISYLVKPVTEEELDKALRKAVDLLNERHHMTQGITGNIIT